MEFASVTLPEAMLLVVEPEFVSLINGVPVTFMLMFPVKILLPVPVISMLFVPKAIVKEEVAPVKFKSAHIAPAAIVTVPVELEVKNTSSADVGTDSPPKPPLDEAHLRPAVPSHVAVPPTQYLLAMIRSVLILQ
jgi:hypothetical protein